MRYMIVSELIKILQSVPGHAQVVGLTDLNKAVLGDYKTIDTPVLVDAFPGAEYQYWYSETEDGEKPVLSVLIQVKK